LQVYPTSLEFQGQIGGPQPDPQYLTIANAGGGIMEWHASADADWIVLGATGAKLSGGRAVQFLVWVKTEGLEAGVYRGTITISSPNAHGSPVHVAVGLKLEPPPKRPAFFEIVDLSVEPISPVAGFPITIKAAIENTGEEAGAKPVELYINGILQGSLGLALNPGQRKTVSFSHTFTFTEAPRATMITVKTPDDQRTLSITVSPYIVCPSGCPFTKIQDAIDAAEPGDTITVGPGTYPENLTITKRLTLEGAGRATISGDGNSPVISISNTRDVTIKGFTITSRTQRAILGGPDGIFVRNSTFVSIMDNTIIGNVDDGIHIFENAQAVISNNTISDNNFEGVTIQKGSKATITDNTIEGEWRDWDSGLDRF